MKRTKRAIALLCALILAASCAALAEEEDAEVTYYDSIYLSALDIENEDWLASDESRALFSVLFLMEVSNAEESGFNADFELCGMPTFYLTTISEMSGLDLTLVLFYEDAGKAWLCSYIPILDSFTAESVDTVGDPGLYMALLKSGGAIGEFYEVPITDIADAVETLGTIIE